MYVGHDVLTVGDDHGVRRRAQRHVQHRAVLGDVDVLAGEHRRPQPHQTGLLRELGEQVDGLRRHPLLGVVQVDALGMKVQDCPAIRVLREQLPQMGVAQLRVVLGQLLVGRPLTQWDEGG